MEAITSPEQLDAFMRDYANWIPGTNPDDSKTHATSALNRLKIQRSFLLGNDNKAKAQAEQLTVSDPESADGWVIRGDILLDQDLPDDAKDAYEKTLIDLSTSKVNEQGSQPFDLSQS